MQEFSPEDKASKYTEKSCWFWDQVVEVKTVTNHMDG